MGKIKSVIELAQGDYNMGFITSYDIIDMILDNIPGDKNEIALKLLEKRDELLKPLNDFTEKLMGDIVSGKDISGLV